MGKKKTGTSKKKSGAKSKHDEEKEWCRLLCDSLEYITLPPAQRYLLAGIRSDEALLQGNSISSASRDCITVGLKEMRIIRKQFNLATKLVKSPINYSLLAEPQTLEDRFNFQVKVAQALDKVPCGLEDLLRDKSLDMFGTTYDHFLPFLWNNIWLQAMVKVTQDDLGLSDDQIWGMKPTSLLPLISARSFTHEKLLKAIVQKFELAVSSSSPAEDIISKLVENMVLTFTEVAPADYVNKLPFAGAARHDYVEKKTLADVAPGEDVKKLVLADVALGEDVKKKVLAYPQVAPAGDVKKLLAAFREFAPAVDVKQMTLAFAQFAPAASVKNLALAFARDCSL